MSKTNLVNTSTGWVIEPISADVARCMVDYALTLDLMDGSGKIYMSIRLEKNFVLVRNGSRKTVLIDRPTSIGQALVLFKKRLLSGHIHSDGNLELLFSNNIRLQIPPDAEYEAWSWVIDNEARFVCMPGGQVAFWGQE